MFSNMFKYFVLIMALFIGGINCGPCAFSLCVAGCMASAVVVTAPVTGGAPILIAGEQACVTFCYLLLGIPSP